MTRALLDVGMVLDDLLDLDRIHVLAAAEDEVALARRQVEPPALHAPDVAGAQPPIGVIVSAVASGRRQ